MAGYDYKYLIVEKEAGIAKVTLNRPEMRNALGGELLAELRDIVVKLPEDKDVKVVVLTGAGDAFSIGGDIRWMENLIKQPVAFRVKNLIYNPLNFYNGLLDIPQPTIAAVNGDAVGMGTNIALLFDFTIAAENARLGDTHVRAGLVAGVGPAIWSSLIGAKKAKQYLLTGNLLTGKEAEAMGLVNKAVPQAEVVPTAMDLAKKLASGAGLAIQWTKMAINKSIKNDFNMIMDMGLAGECLSSFSEDNAESVRAVLEKRKPKFKGA